MALYPSLEDLKVDQLEKVRAIFLIDEQHLRD